MIVEKIGKCALVCAGLFAVSSGAVYGDVAVDASGNLGVGTETPGSSIHVLRGDNTAQVQVEETSPSTKQVMFNLIHAGFPQFNFVDTATNDTWTFRLTEITGESAFSVSKTGTGDSEFRVYEDGDADLRGTLNQGSSRFIKEDFSDINGDDVLAKLDQLPIQEWQYKRDQNEARHVGPFAEDFHAAFQLGKDDKHIAPTDMAGLALASVKALNEKSRQLSERNEKLEEANASLRSEIDRIDQKTRRQEEEIAKLKELVASMTADK